MAQQRNGNLTTSIWWRICLFTKGSHLNDAVEQIVGRERRERLSQLAWCGQGCFDSRRRVNSDVMLLSLIAKRLVLVLGILAALVSTTQANVCDQHLSRIRYIPFEGNAGVDAHYDALIT